MNKAKRLISLGYFPKELPFEFTTAKLADKYEALPKSDPKRRSWPVTFNLSRSETSRRVISIPNPEQFVRQSTLIADNWASIRKVCRASKISLSSPRFSTSDAHPVRATNLAPTQKLLDKKLESAAPYRFVLETDYARFFSSVYTHAISWALHTKEVAKLKQFDSTLLGNSVDLATRNAQGGQTVGIPVGPDVSHIISELIASSIDVRAFKSAWPSGYRYVDDYFLCFESEAEAITALENLAQAARYFEIELNYEKTKIHKVSELLKGLGYDRLRDFELPEGKRNLSRALVPAAS